MDYKSELNDKQYEAVSAEDQYLRIVAGAGSGKTRVLTYRIAYLMEYFHIAPWQILAFTFTNKVANEMKSRVSNMVPEAQAYLKIKTFHSFAAMFLREEIGVLGFPRCFTILDEEDQTKVIKDVAASMGFKRGDKIVGLATNYIGKMKLYEKYPGDIVISKKSFEDEEACLEIYKQYEEIKNNNLSLDFDDLLLKANYILENYPDIRVKWQNRYSQILIDEFQDTNNTEYKLINFLLKPSTCLFVVGDPDQTIYTWRGANQNIILDMPKRFPDIKTVILNENYRSSQTILNSANKLIANNKLRLKKDLFTRKANGDPIIIKSCTSSSSEAEFVAREILRLKQTGAYSYRDIAILYRANYVSREFESEFVQKHIPYRIYGALKFYQRREIKDVLAYFHLIVNIKDNVSYERIINVPRRGIGDTTIGILKNESFENNLSMYEYISQVDPENTMLPKKAINSLKAMNTLIDITRDKINDNDEVFSKTLEDMINSLDYYTYLLKEDDGDDRIENVKSLFEDIRHFLKNNPEATFDEYLQNVSLISAADELEDGEHVTLMTAHTAKGLEFPIVFVTRFNNGVFPSQRAVFESGFEAMEEERRLAYVAFTRAMKKLYISYSKDYSYVIGSTLTVSPFLKESGNVSPDEQKPQQSIYGGGYQYKKQSYFNDGPNMSFSSDEPKEKESIFVSDEPEEKDNGISWKVNDVVMHNKFGRGIIVSIDEDGFLEVNFEQHGTKYLVGTHPALSKGGNEA